MLRHILTTSLDLGAFLTCDGLVYHARNSVDPLRPMIAESSYRRTDFREGVMKLDVREREGVVRVWCHTYPGLRSAVQHCPSYERLASVA